MTCCKPFVCLSTLCHWSKQIFFLSLRPACFNFQYKKYFEIFLRTSNEVSSLIQFEIMIISGVFIDNPINFSRILDIYYPTAMGKDHMSCTINTECSKDVQMSPYEVTRSLLTFLKEMEHISQITTE